MSSSQTSRGSAPRACGELVDEGADRERVEDVVDGAQPADAHVRGRLAGLGAHVRHREREVEHALLQVVEPGLGRPAEQTAESAGTRCGGATATTLPLASSPAVRRLALTVL